MKKQSKTIILFLAITLISCNNIQNINNSSVQDISFLKNKNSKNIQGKVEFPELIDKKYSIKADLSYISNKSTVSIIYPSDYSDISLRNVTIATGTTNNSGIFNINPDETFIPKNGEVFILEASKHSGKSGNDSLTIQTFIQWKDGYWKSITGSQLMINDKTTALVIISSYNPNILPSSETIDKFTILNGKTQVKDISTEINSLKINSVVNTINALLTSNLDPFHYIGFSNNEFYSKVPIMASDNEFLVNTTTIKSQLLPKISINSQGNFIVIWQHNNSTTDSDIYGQLFSSDFKKSSNELKLLSTTLSEISPRVSIRNDGSFVITYSKNGNIFASIFDSLGNNLVSDIVVSNSSTNEVISDIDVYSDGSFIITWVDEYSSTDFDIYAKKYSKDGTLLGSRITIAGLSDMEKEPNIKFTSNGGFIVTYYKSGNIYFKKFNTDLSSSTETLVNTYTIDEQNKPSIGVDSNNNFVVAWQSQGQDGSGLGIYAQRYNSNSIPQGSEFRVNTYTDLNQGFYSLAMSNQGNFIINWSSQGQDTSNYGIYLQRFDSNGNKSGTETLVNTYINDLQGDPSIAISPLDGKSFITVWESNLQDGDNYGIYGKYFLE